jgi:hypothetical protein
MIGPRPSPSRLTTPGTTLLHSGPVPARSTSVAVAVGDTSPAEKPETSRAANSMGSPSASRNKTEDRADRATQASRTGRRPSTSESRPANNSAAITPIAYVANTSVVTIGPNV